MPEPKPQAELPETDAASSSGKPVTTAEYLLMEESLQKNHAVVLKILGGGGRPGLLIGHDFRVCRHDL